MSGRGYRYRQARGPRRLRRLDLFSEEQLGEGHIGEAGVLATLAPFGLPMSHEDDLRSVDLES